MCCLQCLPKNLQAKNSKLSKERFFGDYKNCRYSEKSRNQKEKIRIEVRMRETSIQSEWASEKSYDFIEQQIRANPLKKCVEIELCDRRLIVITTTTTTRTLCLLYKQCAQKVNGKTTLWNQLTHSLNACAHTHTSEMLRNSICIHWNY